MTKFKS